MILKILSKVFSLYFISPRYSAEILLYACWYFYFLISLNITMNTIRLWFLNDLICAMLVLFLGLKADGSKKSEHGNINSWQIRLWAWPETIWKRSVTRIELSVSRMQKAIYFSIIAMSNTSHFTIFAIRNFV